MAEIFADSPFNVIRGQNFSPIAVRNKSGFLWEKTGEKVQKQSFALSKVVQD